MMWSLLTTGTSCHHDSPLDPRFGRRPSIAWAVQAATAGRASADSTRVYFSGLNNELVAVEKATGRIAWRSHTQNTSGQTIGFGTAVSGPNVVMVDIELYAFDRVTGVPRWHFRGETGASTANSNPAANDSLIFEGWWRHRVGAARDHGGDCLAAAGAPAIPGPRPRPHVASPKPVGVSAARRRQTRRGLRLPAMP